MQINPRTGLKETRDSFYKIPLVHQKGIGSLKLNGQMTAVHKVPLGKGITLDFYAKLGKSDELFVTFMGANTADRHFYPRFARVSSMKNRVPALMAFADPTLLMDPAFEMRLAWYLGGPGFDPASAILKAIRKAQGKTGAKHIAFLGGSGGGLIALRISAMIPGSMAFVQDAATNIAHSIPRTVAHYFSTLWPGWDQEKLLQGLPERFDMVRHYASFAPQNYVYYSQNSGDQHYLEKHYTPFKEACGVKTVDGSNHDSSRQFVVYEGEKPGHGQITPAEFDFHFEAALTGWRYYRSAKALR